MVPFGAKTARAVDRYLREHALRPYARSTRLLLRQRGPDDPRRRLRRFPHARPQAGIADVHPNWFGTPSPTAGWPAAVRNET
ncbi:hypothetical protein [Geodermatophilus sp. CPCC 205506]|uniref:hypothetical protein n=1 Tax=Geodermatophilus sp. CPCC 205506 TaxID=2936596 RepID=UPI003EEAA99C